MQTAHRTRQHVAVRKAEKMVKWAGQPVMKTGPTDPGTYLPFMALLAGISPGRQWWKKLQERRHPAMVVDEER